MQRIVVIAKSSTKKNRKDGALMIQCRDIYKSFPMGKETVNILQGISLDVAEGEFVAIVGESGSGKSTFLNVLSGIMPTD
ncbi:MAG: ATP-binding cassette domain-containing protein, partial [Culicoidibacterales bacterium]